MLIRYLFVLVVAMATLPGQAQASPNYNYGELHYLRGTEEPARNGIGLAFSRASNDTTFWTAALDYTRRENNGKLAEITTLGINGGLRKPLNEHIDVYGMLGITAYRLEFKSSTEDISLILGAAAATVGMRAAVNSSLELDANIGCRLGCEDRLDYRIGATHMTSDKFGLSVYLSGTDGIDPVVGIGLRFLLK